MKKECKILGFQECTVKDTGELMLRICMSIKSNRDNYYGDESTFIFLPLSEKLKSDLKLAIDDDSVSAYYTTTDNIISGKTKVNDIIVE